LLKKHNSDFRIKAKPAVKTAGFFYSNKCMEKWTEVAKETES